MHRSLQRMVMLGMGLLSVLSAFADTFVGKVLDESGAPLPGAVVCVDHFGVRVATDGDGLFKIHDKSAKVLNITVSYIGYKSTNSILKSADGNHLNIVRLVPDETSLSEVVITATRTPKPLKDVPVVTRLISESEIAKVDATNIQDLLTEELPGLEFGYAMSQETSLNMSGFGGNAVLFLVDGERLAGETMNNVDYNRLNLDDIGRVEIVKGASSALYGANAVGGVVNLISKENSEPWHLNLNSRYRSLGNEQRYGGNLNINQGGWNFNTSGQYSSSETVKLTSAFDTNSKIHNIFGGNSLNVKQKVGYRFNNGLTLTARGGYFNRVSNRANYDDHYIDYNGGLRGMWIIDNSQNLELSYSFDQYDKERYVGGVRTHDHDYRNRQNIVHGLYTKFYGKNALTIGADAMHDYLTTYQFLDNEIHSQTSLDAFVQLDYSPLQWLNLVASVRDDYFSESRNNALTSRLATMFKFPASITFRASYAGGFRAPSLKEMYMNFDMAGMQMIYGNPDLKPERSHNFNFAVERSGMVGRGILAGSYCFTTSAYHNYYNSRITTAEFNGDSTREPGAIYANEDGVKAMGVDVNMRYRTNNGFGLSGSYNFLHMAGRTIDSQFSQPRPHSATWRIDYTRPLCSWYKLYVGLSGRYLGKPDSDVETDGAYSIWKFTLQQTVWRGININFVVDNLLNYKPKVYYWNSAPTIGRTWSIGVSANINDLL